MRIAHLLSTVGFSFLLVWATVCAGQDASTEVETRSRVAIAAMVNNLDAFPYYSCKFTVTHANAKTLPEARTGKWFNATTWSARVIVDGKKELHETIMPPEPPPKLSKNAKGGLGFRTVANHSHALLSSDDLQMSHSPGLAVNLHNATRPRRPEQFDSPLYMMGLGHHRWSAPDSLLSQSERFEFRPGGVSQWEGKAIVSVRFFKPDNGYIRHWDLDPAQGHLPIHHSWISTRDSPQPQVEAFLMEARKCSRERWFPVRMQNITIPQNEGGDYMIIELNVLELEVDKRPDAKDFYLHVPAGTTVCSDLDTKKSFKTMQDEDIHIEDLPRLFKLWNEYTPDKEMDLTIHLPEKNRRWLWWLVACVVGLLMLLGARTVLRRRHSPSNVPQPPTL